MTCYSVNVDNVRAIVCVGGRAKRCACGARATLLCDWKVQGCKPSGASKTCDRDLCAHCAKEVGPDKHLCGEHQVAYTRWKSRRDSA